MISLEPNAVDNDGNPIRTGISGTSEDKSNIEATNKAIEKEWIEYINGKESWNKLDWFCEKLIKCRAECDRMREALEKISYGETAYSSRDMELIAQEALKGGK